MAEITASAVKELREQTGAGMLDCRNALKETNGNLEQAIQYLREKGVLKAGKKADRTAAEGLVQMHVSASCIALAEVNCETDFVARTDEFKALTQTIADLAAKNCAGHNEVAESDAINSWNYSPSETVAQVLQAKIAEIGENIRARRAICLNKGSVFGGYIHGNGGVGSIVSLAVTGTSSKDLSVLAKDIAMHVAAAAPLSLSRENVPAATVATEKDIFLHQLAEEGKSVAMAEKIVVGKMNKFFAESCLLEQGFIKDPDLSITKLLEQWSKDAGCTISVSGFARFKVGEGIEKVQTDFAAEVASMTK